MKRRVTRVGMGTFIGLGLIVFGLISAPRSANAMTIGYYGADPSAAIATDGFTGVALSNLTAADLTGLNVLWIFNSNNGVPDTTIMGNLPAIDNFVAGGGVLSFNDRNVNQGLSAATYIPGAGSVSFTFDPNQNIDISTPGTLVTNGPGGVIDNTTLDGGTYSDHGWADLSTLPAGAVAIFNNGNANDIVDFQYGYGLGAVYYSSIPLDYYLGYSNPFNDIYAPNELAYQASLAPVPEPSSLFLLAIGLLLGMAFVRSARRRGGSVAAHLRC